MANEGFLGKTTISGEKAATDDHPVIIHALTLASDVTAPLKPGEILKRVEDSGTYVYKPWAPGDTEAPRAVVNEPCDPAVETSAKSVVHGCVKTRLLSAGGAAADYAAIEKLFDTGIYAV
ncbi:MAG: hypothetical protein DELT_02527 [Desulfovibrio sp.]